MKPVRPCIWRAIRLALGLTPSVGPLPYGSVSAAFTASRSRSRPRVKAWRWGRSAERASTIQRELPQHFLRKASGVWRAPDNGRQLGHLGAGGSELGQEVVLTGFEFVGSGEDHPGEPARGDVAAVGVRSRPG